MISANPLAVMRLLSILAFAFDCLASSTSLGTGMLTPPSFQVNAYVRSGSKCMGLSRPTQG